MLNIYIYTSHNYHWNFLKKLILRFELNFCFSGIHSHSRTHTHTNETGKIKFQLPAFERRPDEAYIPVHYKMEIKSEMKLLLETRERENNPEKIKSFCVEKTNASTWIWVKRFFSLLLLLSMMMSEKKTTKEKSCKSSCPFLSSHKREREREMEGRVKYSSKHSNSII